MGVREIQSASARDKVARRDSRGDLTTRRSRIEEKTMVGLRRGIVRILTIFVQRVVRAHVQMKETKVLLARKRYIYASVPLPSTRTAPWSVSSRLCCHWRARSANGRSEKRIRCYLLFVSALLSVFLFASLGLFHQCIAGTSHAELIVRTRSVADMASRLRCFFDVQIAGADGLVYADGALSSCAYLLLFF